MKANKWFVICALIVVALMPVAVWLALKQGRQHQENVTALSDVRSAALDLKSLAHAEERFRMERWRDLDQDNIGEFTPLTDLVERQLLDDRFKPLTGEIITGSGRYSYQTLLNSDPDVAEEELVILAIPLDQQNPMLAIDDAGTVYRSPGSAADMSASNAAIDPRSWPEWQ